MKILDSILSEQLALTTIRRDLHAHPELCFKEVRTAQRVFELLTEWGIEVHRGLGTTGLVGVIKRGDNPRSIGLRADMDALPMQESNVFAHASQHPGQMHACGHDGHTAMLLAAAQHLSRDPELDGTVYLVFQPAEEGGGGAREMIKDGLFERFPMQAIFGMHNWPGLSVGQFALSPGPVMASSNEFHLTIQGKGGHAALPHNSIDPVPIASQLVLAFQTIVTRNIKPVDAAVISVTSIHAGHATNVIPDRCELKGTVRTFSEAVLDTIERRMQEVSKDLCAAFGATCTFEFKRNYPPTINHPQESAFVQKVIQSVYGTKSLVPQEPTMGAEDFSFMLQKTPGAYFFIGYGDGVHRETGHAEGPCVLHNPSYDFNDELIPWGGSLWVHLVHAWLKSD
jgi:hippurate hydrolase